MFSVVMCDDELWALKGMENIIGWSDHGFSSIQAFQRPSEALKAILADEPDLVITDVRMPGLTGLELMEQCRAQGNRSVFVFASAYTEFEYVQQALDGGAFSYLLKPLEEAKVSELATRIQTMLCQQREGKVGTKIRQLVLQTLTSHEGIDISSMIELGKDDGSRYCFYAAHEAPEGSTGCWTRVHDGLYIAIVPHGHRIALPPRTGQGIPFASSDEAPLALRSALIAYYTVLFHAKEMWHLVYKAPDTATYGAVTTLLDAVRDRNKEQALALVDQYTQRSHEQGTGIDELVIFYNALLVGLLDLFPDSEVTENLHSFHGCFQMYGVLQTVEQYWMSIRTLVDLYTTAALDLEESPDSGERAVQYVDKHYREVITLEQLSQQFNMSLSHLCRQFKRVSGMNFTDYLRRRRIEYACSLLRSTNSTIAEIGRQVGYEDYFYFNKVFKKEQGVSPAAYRKGLTDE